MSHVPQSAGTPSLTMLGLIWIPMWHLENIKNTTYIWSHYRQTLRFQWFVGDLLRNHKSQDYSDLQWLNFEPCPIGYIIEGTGPPCFTLFSKRSAHWFHPILPVILDHWPWPWVMSSLSNGIGSNLQNDPRLESLTYGPRDFRKLGWFSLAKHSEKSVCMLKQSYSSLSYSQTYSFKKFRHFWAGGWR